MKKKLLEDFSFIRIRRKKDINLMSAKQQQQQTKDY